MRIAGSIVALCFLAAPSFADPRDPHVAFVDDEPMSHHAAASAAHRAASEATHARPPGDRRTPDDVGQLRSVAVSTPAPAPVDSGPRGATADHGVVAAPESDAPNATANAADVMAELAARQLAKETRRHQREIDGCVTAAQRRHPATVGTVTISISVANRALANAAVTSDNVADFDFASCLVRAARTFKFSLSAAQIEWPVTLTPSAAR